jgi:hypothetical protein
MQGVSTKSAQEEINDKEWDSFEFGSLSCGPGSYYLSDNTVSEYHENITTIEGALQFIENDNQCNPNNPIVMWQLTNPWSNGKDEKPMYLCFHRRKFLRQNLDASTGKKLGPGFAKEVSNYQQGTKFGSPMYFRANEDGRRNITYVSNRIPNLLEQLIGEESHPAVFGNSNGHSSGASIPLTTTTCTAVMHPPPTVVMTTNL